VVGEAIGKSMYVRTKLGWIIYVPTAEPIIPTAVTNQQIDIGITQYSKSIADAAMNAANKIM